MPSHSIIKASNASITETTAPKVAVFVGATAGIAKAALTLLVSKQTPIKVYVAGRDGKRHEPYLQELRALNPQASLVWLEGKVSLLSEIRRLCDESIERPKLCIFSPPEAVHLLNKRKM